MSNTAPKPFQPLKPIVWTEQEIIEGVTYKVPDKIPADAEMKQELTLRARFKTECPDRKPSEYGIWLDYELDEKSKLCALYENVFKQVEKPVSYLFENVSIDEFREIVTAFFTKPSEEKSDSSASTQTSGKNTKNRDKAQS